MRWDPAKYGAYADERSRPFFDLVARVSCESPRRVVDLGCGQGSLSATLASRWPAAVVEGVDSSAEMLAAAPAGPRLHFRFGDIASWQPSPDVDVLISNAALQWVPGHPDLLRSWADALPAGAWVAFQVPGNFDAPSHSLMRSLAADFGVADVLRHDAVLSPSAYADLLLDTGLAPDVWETTYLHALAGDDPVLDWVRGTGLRPVLAALPPARVADFEARYAALLREAYPRRPDGTTLFPFRRIFAVGRKR